MSHRGMPIKDVDSFDETTLRGKPSNILAAPYPFGWKFVGAVAVIIVVGLLVGVGH